MNQPLNFVSDQEPWSIYTLEDGTVIRARLVLVKIQRRGNEYSPEGVPLYDCGFQQILDVTPSDMSRRDADKVK